DARARVQRLVDVAHQVHYPGEGDGAGGIGGARIGERGAERDDALGGVERIGAGAGDVVWPAVLRVPVEVGVMPGGVVVDVPGLVAVAHQVGPGGGVQEQGAIARRLAAVGGTERAEVGERRSVQQQLDGPGAGARGHVLPGDRGDGAVARGVPPRGGRQREQGGGDEGGATHSHMIESSPSCDGRGVAAASFHCRSERNHAGRGRSADPRAQSPGIHSERAFATVANGKAGELDAPRSADPGRKPGDHVRLPSGPQPLAAAQHPNGYPSPVTMSRLAVLLAVLYAPSLTAQNIHPTPAPEVQAVPLHEEIHLDGRLDEAVWHSAPAASGLRQAQPHEGELATQRTEVRFAFDAAALYVGARMYDDSGARGVRTRLVRRDADMNSD